VRLARSLAATDARVLATSDRRAEELVADGRFSHELLDRLSGRADRPAARSGKRRQDIPLLVAQCLEEFASETSQPKRALSPESNGSARLRAIVKGTAPSCAIVVGRSPRSARSLSITLEQCRKPRDQATQQPSFDEARDRVHRSYLGAEVQGNVSQAPAMAKRKPHGLLQSC